jgi:hypothetical protein
MQMSGERGPAHVAVDYFVVGKPPAIQLLAMLYVIHV